MSDLSVLGPGGPARRVALAVAAAAAMPVVWLAPAARAQDVSAPVILQYFESRYGTIERRMADVFKAGYGSMYTPPPGRADSGNFSVGYDQYDRFDLGSAGNPTLYGTEAGLKALVGQAHRAGLSFGVDLVWNHNGFSDLGTPGFAAAGGYPGVALTLQTSNPNAPGYNTRGYNAVDGDFHSPFAGGEIQGRLSGLIDINHSANHQFIRNPVDPADSRNIPAGTTPAYGRLANVADPNNRRFYPDLSGPFISVFDPKTGEQNIKVYSFNPANPMAGTPTPENVTGYLMRNTQWLVQSVGVDMFRLDAAKHVEPWVLDYFDRAVYRSNPRTLLNGEQRHVFAWSEAYTGDQAALQGLVRKDINPSDPGRIGGNRDVLDFPLFFALQGNLTGNGFQNDWRNVRSASFDLNDDGLHNGSQGVTFAVSHDDHGPALSNVAHAYTMMLPGNTIVYFNAKEFGDGRDFPKDGRGDALGGQYGEAITKLVDLRNRYGRGNYVERWVEKENLAYERQKSALVLLSNRTDGGYDSRTLLTSFDPGTPLIELTGNAGNASADPFGDIPKLLVVNNDRTVNLRFLRNGAPGSGNFTGSGYLIYGLATPQGAMSVTGSLQTLAGGTPTPSTNATTRLSDVRVVKGDAFQVKLDTVAVNLLGFLRDRPADGDNALLKIDGGLDLNGNGRVDFVNPDTPTYGFEEFVTAKAAGYFAASGNGSYAQAIDASKLSEGYHYVTVRAFRHRDDGGPAVFTDWRETIYVDRLKPVSAVDGFAPKAAGVNENRQVRVRSVDQTADSVHVLLDLPAALTEQQVLGMIGGGSQTGQIDRDLFVRDILNLTHGNHVLTLVTFEPTGTYNVQRLAGQFTSTIFGAGLGDVDFNGGYSPADVSIFGDLLGSNNAQFNPAGDMNGDGLINNLDLTLLGDRLRSVGADAPTMAAYNNLAGVPEPGAAAVVGVIAGAWAMGRRRRRALTAR